MSDLTKKEQEVLDVLAEMVGEGVEPTVRQLTDRMQTDRWHAQRRSDGEVRSRLESCERKGRVAQFADEQNRQRYRPVAE